MNLKTPLASLKPILLVFAAAVLLPCAVRAQSDGAWIADSDGTWSNSGNWLSGTIADGAGATAYFTNAITGNRTVTSDVARTIGNLVFAGSGANSWVLTNSASFALSNPSGTSTVTVSSNTATINANTANGISGSGALLKNGIGTLAFAWANTYSGGTVIGQGQVSLNNTAAGQLGTGAVTITNGAVLSLYRGNAADDGSTIGSFTNAISIPAGQSGTIWCSPRSVTGSAGTASTFTSPVTGAGTLTMRVNGTARGGNAANFSAFTGTLNVTTRTAADNYPVSFGGTAAPGFPSAKVNLAAGVYMYQWLNPPNTSPFTTAQPIGELSGAAGSSLSGNPVSGRFVNWTVGYLNTTATFAGTIRNDAGAAMITKVGTGIWYLSGTNTYTGSTLVSTGAIYGVTGGSISNSTITVATNAAFGVQVVSAGGQWAGTNFVLSKGSALEFNFGTVAPSTTTAPLRLLGGITATNPVTVNIYGGAGWAIGGVYPLVKYTSAYVGDGFAAFTNGAFPLRVSGILSNDTANSQIDLIVTNMSEPLKWAVGDGSWDVASTPNWKDAGNATTTYQQQLGLGDQVQFDDTASGSSPITVSVATNVSPVSVTFSNVVKNYILGGGSNITGSTALTKMGSGTVTIQNTNVFTGPVNLNGGVLNFSSLTNNLGAGTAINFGGGTLQFASGNVDDISSRSVTFNAGGATIDDGGNTLTFAKPIGNNGPGGLTKIGAGSLTLTGTNKYSGVTIINNGTLALAANTYISNSAAIIVNSGKVLDMTAGGLTLSSPASQILAGSGTINGSVTTASGTTISPATNGTVGTLTFGNDLTFNGGTYACDISTNSHDLIAVNGNLTLNSGTVLTIQASNLTNGTYRLIQYSGLLLSGPGSSANLVISGFSQAGKVAALSDATANEIDLIVTTLGGANITWQGNDPGSPYNWDIETTANFTNSSGTAVVFVQGDKVKFDDTSANPNVSLMAALQPGSVTVASDVNNYTFSDGVGGGVGKLTGSGGITKNGLSTLTVATANLNSGPTVINGGTIQVGNGGSSGDLGSGNITNNAALVFYQNSAHTVSGTISGSGSLTQQGSDVLTVTANNIYSGPTTVSSGALQVGNGGATGTLGSGAITNDGNIIVNRTGTLSMGAIKTGPNNTGYLTIVGPAAVTLSGGNTYIGNTYISNGVVKLAADETLPSSVTQPSSTGWLYLDGGATYAGTLDLNGHNQTVNSLSGAANTVNSVITNSAASGTNTLTVLNVSATTFRGYINDNTNASRIALTVLGANQLDLRQFNSYSGGTFVGEGAILGVHTNSAAGIGSIVLSNNATLNMTGAGTSLDPSVFPNNVVTIVDNATANITSSQIANGFAGTIVGNANATANISGTATVGFSSQSTKQLQGLAGTLRVQSGSTLRFSANAPVLNGGDGTTFDVQGSITPKSSGTISMNGLTGSGTLGYPGSGTMTYIVGVSNASSTFSGTISGVAGYTSTNVALVKSGTGALTLSGTLSYSGNTTVSNGTLILQTALDYSPSINLVTNTSQLDVSLLGFALGNATSQTLSGSGTVIGNLNVSPSYPSIVSPGTAGTAGTLTINGNLTLNNGTTNIVDLSGSQFTPGGGTNDLIKVNGDLALGGVTYIRPNFIGSSSVTFGVPYTIIQYTGALTGDTNNLALDTLNYPHLSAVFSTSTAGAVTVTFTGTSNLVWRGDSTNSWQVGVVTNWFDGSGSNIFGQLDKVAFDNSASNFNAILVGTLLPNGISVNSDSNYVFSGSGKLSGATSLIKDGAGVLTLTNGGGNDFSGATVVSNGVIFTRNANTLSPNSSLQIQSAGTVKLNGYSASVGGLSGSGLIDNNGAAATVLTIGSQGNGIWSGTITNSGAGGVSLVVNDTNTFVISGTNQLNSATASQVNNGTAASLILTNTGIITGTGEFWVGCEGAVTGKVVVAGGSLTITNWIVVGRNNTNANGTLVVNSGTVQKAGANNIVVGSLGATGTLTVNGGQVLNNGMLWVGEAPSANATVNLNGGLLQATQVRTNYNGGAPNSSVVNFNGGTLQASAASANFLAVYAANIQNGGLILDDGGFAISVAQPLLNAGSGGLVKQGAGTVYLDGVNTYSGATVVTNGTLAGIGTLASAVTVGPAAKLGAGDAAAVGKLTINSAVNIAGGATLRINKTGGVKTNDQVVGVSTVNYGGTLVVNNITTDATPLSVGDTFTLFSAGSHNGSFSSIVGAPSGLGYTFTNGVLTVISGVATNPTNITFSVSGNSLNLSWPSDHLGWTLQTNATSLTDTNAWFPYPGSTATTSVSLPLDVTKTNVFFRLKY